MKKPVRQIDIAEALGLSRATVAKALIPHLRNRLAPATSHRVLEMAKKMGYQPNLHAQNMQRGRSNTIGVIQFGLFRQSIELHTLYVSHAIQKLGYLATVQKSPVFAQGLEDAVAVMIQAQVEGLLLLSPGEWMSDRVLENLEEFGIPVVGLNGVSFSGVPEVRTDMKQAFFDLTTHLLTLGFHRPALLLGRSRRTLDIKLDWSVLERQEGFESAVAEWTARSNRDRKEVVPEVVRSDLIEDWLHPYEIGRKAMHTLLARPGSRPDVVLCENDNWAAGALIACREAGLSVPDDIAITGCGDEPFVCCLNPPLTTISLPSELMANQAVDLLHRCMQKEVSLTPEQSLIRMACPLVIRESCGSRIR